MGVPFATAAMVHARTHAPTTSLHHLYDVPQPNPSAVTQHATKTPNGRISLYIWCSWDPTGGQQTFPKNARMMFRRLLPETLVLGNETSRRRSVSLDLSDQELREKPLNGTGRQQICTHDCLALKTRGNSNCSGRSHGSTPSGQASQDANRQLQLPLTAGERLALGPEAPECGPTRGPQLCSGGQLHQVAKVAHQNQLQLPRGPSPAQCWVRGLSHLLHPRAGLGSSAGRCVCLLLSDP